MPMQMPGTLPFPASAPACNSEGGWALPGTIYVPMSQHHRDSYHPLQNFLHFSIRYKLCKNKHSLVVPNKRPFCRHHYVKSSYVSQPNNRSKLSHFPCSGPSTVVFWNCVSSGKHMSGETSQISGVCHRELFLFFKLHFILASNFIDWSSKQSQE